MFFKKSINLMIVLFLMLNGCDKKDDEKTSDANFNGNNPAYNFKTEKKFAIVVGVNDYVENSGFNKLDYSLNDAEALKDELEKNGYKVKLLTNDHAYKHSILKDLDNVKSFFNDNEGTLVFAFSGHGYSHDKVNYLATKDTVVDSLVESGLSLNDIKERLNNSGAKKRIMFIDACRNNAFKDKGVSSKGFVYDGNSEGISILYSTKEGEVSYETSDLKHSIFSYHLINGFKDAKREEDGALTFNNLSQYVRDKVIETSLLSTKSRNAQTPYYSSDGSGRFILSVNDAYKPYYPERKEEELLDKKIEEITNRSNEEYYSIQIAAFSNKNSAETILSDLAKEGVSARIEEDSRRNLHMVLVGKFTDKSGATEYRKEILKKFPNGKHVKNSLIKKYQD